MDLELGADDYVAKPVSPRQVAARVRAITPLIIDAERKQARLEGRLLPRSRNELRQLKVLAMEPGRGFSRARLFHLAWDEPTTVFARIVDRHGEATPDQGHRHARQIFGRTDE